MAFLANYFMLKLLVFLALLILEPCQTQADVVAYGTRLSSVGKPSSTSSAASAAAAAAVPKASHVDKLQVSSSQPVPLKRSPSHYEVDLPNSEGDGNGGDGGDRGDDGCCTANHCTNHIDDCHIAVVVVGKCQWLTMAGTGCSLKHNASKKSGDRQMLQWRHHCNDNTQQSNT